MGIIELIVIISISLYVFIRLSLDKTKGIMFVVLFLIIMPRELSYEIGGIPSITGYRGIMIILLIYYLSNLTRATTTQNSKIPLISIMLLILLIKYISLFNAYNFAVCFNGFVVYLLEVFFYYLIMLKLLDNNLNNIHAAIKGIVIATIIIAILGFIEKYTLFSPIDSLAARNSNRFETQKLNSVFSTFSHPIHFGVALAMGWSMCIYILDRTYVKINKYLIWLSLLILYAGLYFSDSRGPWMGFLIAVLVFFFLKYPFIKLKMTPIIFIALFIIFARPGVYDSIDGLVSASFDSDSREGGSVAYRFDLYNKAIDEISKSYDRFLIGYGADAHHSMDLSGEISYGTRGIRSFWSWDSEFAIILLESGIIGFILYSALFFTIYRYFIRLLKYLDQEKKKLVIAILASISVFLFMMTNVAIFSPSLHFLFWSVVAVGVSFSRMCFQEIKSYDVDRISS